MNLLPPWTYTSLNDFDNCPHKYFRKYVLKDLPKEPASPEMKVGIEAHAMMEQAIKNDRPLPAGAPTIAKNYLARLKPFKPQAEAKLAVDAHGRPVDFFDKSAVGRGKADIIVIGQEHGVILDWKTGKVREDPFELEVFAYLASRLLSHVKKWMGVYIWLKDGRAGKPHFLDPNHAQQRIASLWATIENCNNTNNWPKNENPLCGWCNVTDCQFNKRQP